MPRYSVILNGRNFWLTIDDEPRRMGFFTTRFVEAADPEAAEVAAVELLRQDDRLAGQILNDPSDPPTIHLHKIRQLDTEAELRTQQGFTYYAENDDA